MSDRRTIAVIGAAGVTGREVVSQAIDRGHAVRAFERSWEGASLPAEGVERRTANLLQDELQDAFAGCDAVISAVGIGLTAENALHPPPLYTEGAVRLIRGLQASNVRRLVVISASFVASRRRGPLWFRLTSGLALDRVFTQMAEMERILRAADGIDWTAVRPGWLMEGELTADYVVTPDVIPPHLIRTRHADLAHFMLDIALSGDWLHQTPAIARDEPASANSPDKVVQSLLGQS